MRSLLKWIRNGEVRLVKRAMGKFSPEELSIIREEHNRTAWRMAPRLSEQKLERLSELIFPMNPPIAKGLANRLLGLVLPLWPLEAFIFIRAGLSPYNLRLVTAHETIHQLEWNFAVRKFKYLAEAAASLVAMEIGTGLPLGQGTPFFEAGRRMAREIKEGKERDKAARELAKSWSRRSKERGVPIFEPAWTYRYGEILGGIAYQLGTEVSLQMEGSCLDYAWEYLRLIGQRHSPEEAEAIIQRENH